MRLNWVSQRLYFVFTNAFWVSLQKIHKYIFNCFFISITFVQSHSARFQCLFWNAFQKCITDTFFMHLVLVGISCFLSWYRFNTFFSKMQHILRKKQKLFQKIDFFEVSVFLEKNPEMLWNETYILTKDNKITCNLIYIYSLHIFTFIFPRKKSWALFIHLVCFSMYSCY